MIITDQKPLEGQVVDLLFLSISIDIPAGLTWMLSR